MNNTNVFVFTGRIAKDIDASYSPSGMGIARVTIASSNDRYNKETESWDEHTDWFEVTFFGKPAENYFLRNGKGDIVCVTCSIHQYEYTNDDGKKVRPYRFTGTKMETIVRKNKPQEPEPNEEPEPEQDDGKAPF